MAEGWLRNLADGALEVYSAGTRPEGVSPHAVRAMAEIGIDISTHTSDHVDRYAGEPFDLVVTVCDSARENCPVFPNAKRQIHRGFRDPDLDAIPEEERFEHFRAVRDEIGTWARSLVTEIVPGT